MKFYHANCALLAEGVRASVRIAVENGLIACVEAGATLNAGDELISGLVLPGMANVHSHSFQRAMAGLAEWDAGGTDNFWSWREAMYRFAERLDPDSQRDIARFLFIEMLKAGYTSVGEFHYLHNQPGGTAFAPTGAMASAIAEAAHETMIELTMLPTLYVTGGADGRALNERQKRFGKTVEELLRLRIDLKGAAGVTNVGLALHSLRAAPAALMHEAIAGVEMNSPLHIHAAEQVCEVDESLATYGLRPVEYLLKEFQVDRRWCLVHSTHLSENETVALAQSGAVAGLCPATEGNLGDGIFQLPGFLSAGGALAVGGDSHICVDPAEELRMLEYSQRLLHRRRNVAASPAQPHTAARLWTLAARGGAQALGLNAGEIAVGMRADVVVVDTDHVSLAGRDGAQALDSYVFVAGKGAVRDVMVAGVWLVKERHHAGEACAAIAYRSTVKKIISA
ncbi:MAG: formimidoylglutamate deiminase [Alphaproteobacteria bacterium]|nr:formimidoylglutamate deiminase [Alphaproteobacteria bacterium]